MSSRKVLVAGDSRLFQETIPQVLEGAGLGVLRAADGLDAIERAASEDVAVVLLDVGLPRMNGYQACRLLKTEPSTRDLPVIVLTMREQAADRYWGVETGADYYVAQDAEPHRIVELVRNVLADRAAHPRQRPQALRRSRLDILSRVNQLLDRKLYEATLLSEIGRVARDLMQFDETFVSVMAVVGRAVDFTLGGMGFVEGDDLEVVLVLHRQAAPAAVEAARAGVVDAAVRARGSALGRVQWRVVQAGGALAGPEDTSLHGMFAVPVVTSGRLAGLLVLAGGATARLSAETQVFLDELAAQAHIVLENSRLFQRVKDLSIRDGLTGLFNHRHILELVAQAVERADRYQEPVSLLMADIDHFKAVNDQHGHLAGDALLRDVSRVLRDTLRSVDAIGRYGGEEFLILLPHTGYQEAMLTAERLRRRVQDHAFRPGERDLRLTVSVGVFSCPSPLVATAADLVREADRSLYRAKGGGRNRVR